MATYPTYATSHYRSPITAPRRLMAIHGPPLTSHFSPLTNHFSLLLSRHLLCAWLGAKFVGKEREDIGLVRDLLIQRAPDPMSE
jgi:hypothetical protein